MKRSAPLQRRTPLKPGKGFTRQQIERKPQPLYKLARPCRAAVISTTAVPVPKAEPVRSEAYRRLVAGLPCIYCGIEGISQHAHANQGKGMALKVCDLMGFPLCCDQPGRKGCHPKLDQGALFTKIVRREVELEWARRTVRFLLAADRWPNGLRVPDWAEA